MDFNYRVEYSNTDESNNYNKKVIIIRGASGSGKSTFAKSLKNELVDSRKCEIFEADQYFYDSDGNYNFTFNRIHAAHIQCLTRFKKFLVNNDNCVGIVSNTSIKTREFKKYVRFALKNNYELVIIKMLSLFDNEHNVQKWKVDKMNDSYVPFNIENYKENNKR